MLFYFVEMLIWVIPSVLLDIYIPIFILVGGGSRLFNENSPKRSQGL